MLQFLSGVLKSEYGGDGYEAAHYVTALMVHDFMVAGSYDDPFGIAEDFYLNFPKVELGELQSILSTLLYGLEISSEW